MRTKEEALKDQQELKKLVPENVDLVNDVPFQVPSKLTGKAVPQKKPKQQEPAKQSTSQKNQEPTKTTGADMEPVLYVQLTPANPRCGVPALSKRVSALMGQDPKDGDMFAFTDRWNKTIQVLQQTESGTSLLKKKLDEAAKWPGFSLDNKTGPMVLKGEAKDKFLRRIGCPKDLSK